jgi:hypothetical protein
MIRTHGDSIEVELDGFSSAWFFGGFHNG